jgi:hypothetical protein
LIVFDDLDLVDAPFPVAYRGELAQPCKRIRIRIRNLDLENMDLANRFIENDSYAGGKVQTSDMWIIHRNGTGIIPMFFQEGLIDPGGLTTENKMISLSKTP